jgi:8-oxo-dGTP pyrophosphatase MutT (NUDIX family)
MFAMLKHKVRKMIQTDEVTTTSLSRKEKSTIRDEIELRYGKIKSTKSRKEKSLIRDEIEALYKKLNSGAETKKEDNKTLKKSKEILNKGLELTFDDLKFFTSDIVSELDKLVDEQNSEAIEVEALFDGVITMFSLGGKIQTDSIDNKSDVVASVSLITDEKGNYLIGKRRDSGKYSFIGGGIEDGETPLEAMIREAQEESGYIYSEDEITSLGNLSNEAVTIALFEMESKGNPSNASDNDEEFESFLFVDKETLLDGETIDFHIPIEKNLVIAYLKKGV